MSSQISILVVDDEKAVVLTFEKLLSKTFPDIKVYTAENGKEAWDIITVHHPNIVISDINMPVMDGFQLLIKVRSNPDYNDIVFILLTGNTEVSERIKALDKGADEFITKPVVSVALEARIRSALRIVRLQQQMKEENQLLIELAEELEKDIHDMALLAVKFMQARIPTSQEMLSRVAEASVWIARQLGKFSDEEIRDIEIAALLSQAGRMSLPDHLLRQPIMIDGNPTDPIMMQVPNAAREIVSGVRRFADIGKILYSLYENFDGSGFPQRLQSWQIPFASRIIRAALDYEENKARTGKKGSDIINIMKNQANRLYDPRIVILLEQYIYTYEKELQNPNEVPVLLSDLKEGMILAREIVTEKGLKLLPASAVLKKPIIDRIIAHNTTDPILGNIYVKKSSVQ
jgi:response regulator RpfG family c-di-GMP phosphodiesterase